ncbi:MAG: hypothetical protein GY804_13305 [Alphaproteobacteria bacterium]|nr:hypothetical protein [Alphaproteobacteria bacterium]
MLSSELHKLLSEGVSGTQVELVNLLKEKGIETTQSSVSRALRKIGAVKGAGERGGVVYSLPPRTTKIKEDGGFLGALVNDITDNGFVIMILTHSGTANTVAQFIDEQKIDNIMGTIAGDDSIMIVPQNVQNIGELVETIKLFVGFE